MSKLGQKYNI